MKKNDKIIVTLGVVILLLASVGIYYYNPMQEEFKSANIKDFEDVHGVLKDVPTAITVADTDPFYPLIATPVAVHYDLEGMKEAIPLYVENLEDPSNAVTKVKYQLEKFDLNQYSIDGSKSAKEVSLEIAQNFWESSEAAILIESNESGYCLGVIATPIASYLSIPVIVTDKIDYEVTRVLSDLGVKNTIVCGNLQGYGDTLKFSTVEEIVDAQISILIEKFGDINYLTLTNPVDAYPPEVLNSTEIYFGENSEDWSFTIPNDYKYALVKFESNADTPISFTIGADLKDIHPVLQQHEIIDAPNHAMPTRDAKGNILGYTFYRESVVYDRGGVTYNIYGLTDVSALVTIEKLEDPVYPMMKGLSTLAPYLTAFHQGLIFGKPDFAFTANDDIRNENGEKLSGFYMPRYNQELTTISNKHVYDNIHRPLNDVLAKIAGTNLGEKTYDGDIKFLRDYFDSKDFSIAIVGDPTVIPQYIYQNLLEPFGDINDDGIDDTAYAMGGGGTASDTIYGNIDPVKYDWSNKAQDIYSDLPHMENVVGRIAAWDVQDADALILRSLFYDDIIENMEGWKNNFGILIGDGVDHQKPWIRFKLEQWLGVFSLIKNIASRIPLTAGIVQFMDANGPWKHETGATELSGLRIKELTAEAMGFDVNFALKTEGMIEGYSEEELDQVKDSNILYKLLWRKSDLRGLIGDQVVKGGEYMENSNYIFANGHGAIPTYGMDGPDLVSAGFGKIIEKITRRLTPIGGGWMGPSFGLGKSYTSASVPGLDMGPSFMFLDSCTCGKIDGVYPEQNVVMAHIQAGVGTIIASTTGSNIPGGYLPGKNKMTDTPLSVWRARKIAEKNAKQGIYPDLHFGFKMFEDMSAFMKEEDCSVGEALKLAKNKYLPEDISWELWWTPPLSSSADAPDVYGPHEEAKYTTYFEFTLYGDPAFNPYEPINEG
jgi:hypothetical protein